MDNIDHTDHTDNIDQIYVVRDLSGTDTIQVICDMSCRSFDPHTGSMIEVVQLLQARDVSSLKDKQIINRKITCTRYGTFPAG